MINKIIAFLFCFLMLFAGLYYTYGKDFFLRKTYPVEAWWAAQYIECSEPVPALLSGLKHVIYDYGSLKNQLVLIRANGDIIQCKSGHAVTHQTRFRYASLTKVLTASLFLEQENHQIIHRDDDLSVYLPLKNPHDSRFYDIQLKDLIMHSSGFDRLRSRDPMIQAGKKSWCPYHLEQINQLTLDHVPKKYFSYDNRNYCLLAMAMEKATGQSYANLMQQFLSKRGFSQIKFIKGPRLADEVEYDFRFEEYYFPSYMHKFDFFAMQPVAGLSGSATDYAKLIHHIIYKDKLPLIVPNRKMKTPTGEEIRVSLGLRESNFVHGEHVYQHTGTLPASRSLVMIRENGDILVWLGSGMPKDYKNTLPKLMEYFSLNIR